VILWVGWCLFVKHYSYIPPASVSQKSNIDIKYNFIFIYKYTEITGSLMFLDINILIIYCNIVKEKVSKKWFFCIFMRFRTFSSPNKNLNFFDSGRGFCPPPSLSEECKIFWTAPLIEAINLGISIVFYTTNLYIQRLIKVNKKSTHIILCWIHIYV